MCLAHHHCKHWQTAAKGQGNTELLSRGLAPEGARDEGYKTQLQLRAFGLPNGGPGGNKKPYNPPNGTIQGAAQG